MASVRLLMAALLVVGVLPPPADAGAAGQGTASAVRPVPGAVVRGFEPPAHAYAPGHRGVKLAAEPGDTVRAALPGVVSFSGEVARRGWVTLDHGGGLRTTYGWLDPRRVQAGDRVDAGQPLGAVAPDTTAVHWGARLDGQYVDPLALLGHWRVRLLADR